MSEQETILRQVLPYLRQLGYQTIRPEQRFGTGSRKVVVDAAVYDDRDQLVASVEVKPDLGSIPERVGPYHPLVQQALRNALVSEAPNVLLTDGIRHLWFRVDFSTGSLEPIEKPPRAVSVSSVSVPFRDTEEVQRIVSISLDHFRRHSHGMWPTAEDVLLDILQAKVQDEISIEEGKKKQFWAAEQEPDEQVMGRLQGLYGAWSSGEILPEAVPHEAWISVVRLLQPFDWLRTDRHFIKPILDRIMSSSMKTTKGQFVTPHGLVDLMVQLVDPQPGERVLDPCCGTGGFVAEVVARWAGANDHKVPWTVFGVDFDPYMVQMARLNLAISGGRPDRVFIANSLDQKALDGVTVHRATFDVAFADPPIGMTAVDELSVLDQYELVQRRRLARQRPEVLFLERCLQLLKPGGRMAIILPEVLVASPRYGFVREWLAETASIDAVISLPFHAFAPAASVKSCILLLRKERSDAEQHIFMAIAQQIGYDQLGRPDNRSDLADILEQYRWQQKSGSVPRQARTWTVALGRSDLTARLDAPFYQPETRRVFERLRGLTVPVVELGEIAQTIARGSVVPTAAFSESGVPVIGSGQISAGELDLLAAQRVPDSFLAKVPDYLVLREGDLLVSVRGQIGKAALVSNRELPAIAGQGTVVVRLVSGTVSPEFLRLLFATEWIRRQLDIYAQRGGAPELHAEDLKKVLVPILEEAAQSRLVDRLRQAAELRKRAEHLEQQVSEDLGAILETGTTNAD